MTTQRGNRRESGTVVWISPETRAEKNKRAKYVGGRNALLDAAKAFELFRMVPNLMNAAGWLLLMKLPHLLNSLSEEPGVWEEVARSANHILSHVLDFESYDPTIAGIVVALVVYGSISNAISEYKKKKQDRASQRGLTHTSTHEFNPVLASSFKDRQRRAQPSVEKRVAGVFDELIGRIFIAAVMAGTGTAMVSAFDPLNPAVFPENSGPLSLLPFAAPLLIVLPDMIRLEVEKIMKKYRISSNDLNRRQ